MQTIVFREESYKIMGACFEVYKQKGAGFTEPVYQECLAIEFELRGIPFVSQPALQLEYKGRILTQSFRPDFVCFDNIIVEIKAVENIVDAFRSQALNYLNATRRDLALLVNFGSHPKLEYERMLGPHAKVSRRSASEEIQSWRLDQN
jgi:GxxExxY protein